MGMGMRLVWFVSGNGNGNGNGTGTGVVCFWDWFVTGTGVVCVWDWEWEWDWDWFVTGVARVCVYSMPRYAWDDVISGSIFGIGLTRPIVQVDLGLLKVESIGGQMHTTTLFYESLLDARKPGEDNLPFTGALPLLTFALPLLTFALPPWQ
jgi:hypothetical protein